MAKESRRGRGAGPPGSALRRGKDGPQIVRYEDGAKITDEAVETFLGHLAATCNVTRAAKLTGFSKEAFYNRRDRDPVFFERWRRTVVESYGEIEGIVLRTAKDLLEGRQPPPESPIRAMTMADAIQLLKLYRGIVTGEGKRAGWRPVPRPLDEVRDSILAKLEAIERWRREEEAEEERNRREAGGGGASEAA
jgi:hypothetical protein